MSSSTEKENTLGYFKDAEGKFPDDPWTAGNHNLTQDREPWVYGSIEDNFQSPYVVEWVKDAVRYSLYLKSTLNLTTNIIEVDPEEHYSGIEIHSTLRGEKLREAVLYALTFQEIKDSQVLSHLFSEEN